MHAALQCLRKELADLDSRRVLVTEAIAAVELVIGTLAPAAERPVARDPVGVARVQRLVAAERKAAVTIKADQARIVDLLASRGPSSMGDLSAALGVTRNQIVWLLKNLRLRGVVEADGVTHNRVFRLAAGATRTVGDGRRVAAVEEGELEVVWNGATKRSPEDVLRSRREAQA